MRNRTNQIKIPKQLSNKYDYTSLKRTDRAILEYLTETTIAGDGKTCKASIPRIANACNISERQVQISIRRLIMVGLLKRIEYDFGNPDRMQRGTVYKVLSRKDKAHQRTVEQAGKKRTVKFLLFWSEDK